MTKSGIYKIINIVNGKYYLGSSDNIDKRWKKHRCDLRHNRHHSIHLQRAWNKYGEKSFIFEIIEKVETKMLLEKEQFHLDTYKPWNDKIGYNISKSASGGDLVSYHPDKKNIIKRRVKTVNDKIKDMTDKERKEKWARPMENNPNWRGGTTFYTCPICGTVIRKWGGNKNSCGKCRNRDGELNPFFGKQHTNATKKKLSRIRKLKGNIDNTQKLSVEVDGVVYSSFSEAAKKLDCAVASIRNRLNNPIKFPNYKLITQP